MADKAAVLATEQEETGLAGQLADLAVAELQKVKDLIAQKNAATPDVDLSELEAEAQKGVDRLTSAIAELTADDAPEAPAEPTVDAPVVDPAPATPESSETPESSTSDASGV